MRTTISWWWTIEALNRDGTARYHDARHDGCAGVAGFRHTCAPDQLPVIMVTALHGSDKVAEALHLAPTTTLPSRGTLVNRPFYGIYNILFAIGVALSYNKRASVMRTVVASAMVLFLVGVVALCPAIACTPSASSCCHKPAKTVPDCPYSILQKSKTNPAATHAKWIGAIVRPERSSALPAAGPRIEPPCRLVDVSGLFLRNRVLLI
jgi:hypothetical protein